MSDLQWGMIVVMQISQWILLYAIVQRLDKLLAAVGEETP